MSKSIFVLVPFACLLLVVACGKESVTVSSVSAPPEPPRTASASMPIARDYDDPAVRMSDAERSIHEDAVASGLEGRDDRGAGGAETPRRAPNVFILFFVGIGLVFSGWNVTRLFRAGREARRDAFA